MRGEYSPSLVLLCVQRLPEDSLTVALMRGGRHLFGWSSGNAQMADLFDALNLNTRMTGMWKGKPPELPSAYRPKVETPKAKPRLSVADLHARLRSGPT